MAPGRPSYAGSDGFYTVYCDVVSSRLLALFVRDWRSVSFWISEPFLPSVLSLAVVPAFRFDTLHWYIRQEHDSTTFPVFSSFNRRLSCLDINF